MYDAPKIVLLDICGRNKNMLSRFSEMMSPPKWMSNVLTYKYVKGETIFDDAILSPLMAGFAMSFINGAIRGYFASVSNKFLDAAFYGIVCTYLGNIIPTSLLMGPFALIFDELLYFNPQSYVDISFGLLTSVATNSLGLLSSELMGYELNSFNYKGNSMLAGLVNTKLSDVNGFTALANTKLGKVSKLTALEGMALTAWAGFHLYRLFNASKIETMLSDKEMNHKKLGVK